MVRRWTLPVEHLSIATIFILCGLLVNVAQASVFALFWFTHRPTYRFLVHNLQYAHWSIVSWIGFYYSGSRLKVLCSDDDLPHLGREAAIMIPNHRYSLDFLTTVMVPDQFGALGIFKAMQKKSIKWYPVIGWDFWFCENIFLARDAARDIKTIENGVNQLVDSKMPFWMCLYAEGTRFTKAKHEQAEEIATQKGYPPLQYHLQPRPTGFVTIMKQLRENKSQPVMLYDMTILQQKNENRSMLDLLNLRPVEFTVFIKRIPVSDVPEGSEVTWLRQNYQQKDKRFSMMLNDDLEQVMTANNVKLQKLQTPTGSKVITYCWALTVLPLTVYAWAGAIIKSGLYGTCFLIALPICLVLLTGAIIRTGDMKSSSSYGLKKKE